MPTKAFFRLFPFLASIFVNGTALAFQPFFDDDPATRHAPADPPMTDLDLDVLLLCGGWGAEVEARDFERMMLKKEHSGVLERIGKAVGHRIYGKAQQPEELVRQLRRVWFEQKGFKHVFCGEPGDGGYLGGLHYAPRYWQLQDEGWGGYRKLKRDVGKRPLEKCRKHYLRERIAPPVYSVGVEFQDPAGGRNGVKCLSGYNRLMSAEDLLIAGTLAFKQANKRVPKNAKEACLFETRRPDVPKHYSTLVIKQRALRSFYPQAEKKPYCRKNRKDLRACLCSRL